MSFRYRKSINLGKGVRLNLSKTGIGVSAGVPGARYSTHSSGRTTKTVGLPGTGVYYRKDTQARKAGSSRSAPARKQQAPAAAAAAVLKAGAFAPREEKDFVSGVNAYRQGQYQRALASFQAVAAADTTNVHIAEEFFAGLCLVGLDRAPEAIPYFEAVLASDFPVPDRLMEKYGVGGAMEIGITSVVSVTIPMSTLAVALMLAEIYQRTDRRQQAIDLLESSGSHAPTEPAFALSLADLYDEAEEYQEVVRVTDGYQSNDEDVSLCILGYRAYAMTQLGLGEAALAITKEGLKSKKRRAALLVLLRYVRAQAYETVGKLAMAKKEFEKVYSEQADFADVAERLGLTSISKEQTPAPPDA